MWQFTIEAINGKHFSNYNVVAEYQAAAIKMAKAAFLKSHGCTGYVRVLMTNYQPDAKASSIVELNSSNY